VHVLGQCDAKGVALCPPRRRCAAAGMAVVCTAGEEGDVETHQRWWWQKGGGAVACQGRDEGKQCRAVLLSRGKDDGVISGSGVLRGNERLQLLFSLLLLLSSDSGMGLVCCHQTAGAG
jgi:hypothetical protein